MVIYVLQPPTAELSPYEYEDYLYAILQLLINNSPFVHAALQRLMQTYEALRSHGPGRVIFVSDPSEVDMGDRRHMYASLFEYYLLRSLVSLGDECFQEQNYEASYENYNMAHDHYKEKFGPNFSFTRSLRVKLMRTLMNWGQFERIVVELKYEDDLRDTYSDSNDAIVTLFLRYAYGLALVRTERSLEAIPYLCQFNFGDMDLRIKANLKILRLTLGLVLHELSLGNADFGMRMYRGLAVVIEPRFHRRDCPGEYIEFCATFAHVLRRDDRLENFLELFVSAAEFHFSFWTVESRLLASGIGCSFPVSTHLHQFCLKDVVRIHQWLEGHSSVQKHFTMRHLEVTAKFVYTWAGAELAYRVLKSTYDKFKYDLDCDHPIIALCLKAIAKMNES